MLTFIRYMEVHLTFALLDCVRYNEDFVKLGFFSIHSPVILARQKKIVRYTEDFVIERFVISRFQCTMTHKKILPPGKEISEDI